MATLGAGPRTFLGIVLAALLATGGRLGAQSTQVDEDDIKAAFLYNFAKYVEWPASVPPSALRVCVVARPVFVQRVDDIIAGETINGRPVTRAVPATPHDARLCQILFIEGAAIATAEPWLAAVHGEPVVTVGDSPELLSRGGIILFIREGDRVRFDVNVGEAQRGGLTVSSRLLRVARRVIPDTPAK